MKKDHIGKLRRALSYERNTAGTNMKHTFEELEALNAVTADSQGTKYSNNDKIAGISVSVLKSRCQVAITLNSQVSQMNSKTASP